MRKGNDDLLTDTYDLPEDFDFNRENTDGLTRVPYFTGIKHINCTGTKSFYGYEYAYREDTFKPMTFNFSLPNVSYKLEF